MIGRVVIVMACCVLAASIAGLGNAEASTEPAQAAAWGAHGPMHTVQWGDTLWGIALRYGTSVQAIMRANGLRSDRIYASPGGRQSRGLRKFRCLSVRPR